MAQKLGHDAGGMATERMVAASFTDRDHDLLAVLTLRVRTMTLQQIATLWTEPARTPTHPPFPDARRRVELLMHSGLVEITPMLAHPAIELTEPLAVWQPGLPPPAFGEIAYAAKSRWKCPPVVTEFVTATTDAGRLMGGQGGRHPRTSEASHDMHLAAVYLRMRRELRTRSESWRSEAQVLAKRDGAADKLPDALVRDGRSKTAIEFVGEYPATKLAAFHGYCEREGFGYELW